jgi:hypothetical protein
MRGIVTLGGILTLLLLAGLSAMGEELENATDGEDPWTAIDANLIASKVEVKDISGKYADITQGVYAEIDGNDTMPYPYQEDGLFIWTIEQHGSALLGTIESTEGYIYKLIGATSMDEVMLVYYGPETDDETNLTVEVEGLLDGEILESGEIVLNGIGYEYTIDPENADNYTFNDYFAETTVLTPIEE